MDIHIYRQTDIQTYMAHAYIQTDGHTYLQTDGWMDEQTSCFIFSNLQQHVAVSSIEQQYGANLLQPPDINYKKLKIFIDGM